MMSRSGPFPHTALWSIWVAALLTLIVPGFSYEASAQQGRESAVTLSQNPLKGSAAQLSWGNAR